MPHIQLHEWVPESQDTVLAMDLPAFRILDLREHLACPLVLLLTPSRHSMDRCNRSALTRGEVLRNLVLVPEEELVLHQSVLVSRCWLLQPETFYKVFNQGMGMMQQKMPVQLGGGPPGKADKPGLPSSRPNSANTGPSTPQVGSFQHKLLVTFDVESNKRQICGNNVINQQD